MANKKEQGGRARGTVADRFGEVYERNKER
jgi:hypothetical protein